MELYGGGGEKDRWRLAFAISKAQKSLSNRSMSEGESIPSFVAAVRVLVEGLEEAGGELNYPECIATCINNVDATRFHNWVYDKIRDRVADSEITLNELLNDLAAWERDVWRPFASTQNKSIKSSDRDSGQTGAGADRSNGRNRNVKNNSSHRPGMGV